MAPFVMPATKVIEDTRTYYNPKNDEGQIEEKKFFNQVGAKCIFKQSTDYCDIVSKPGNIYLVDIYRFGFGTLPNGRPIKMEHDDDMGAGNGESCELHSQLTGYYTRLSA
jgi:hypothetical protein